MTDQTPALSLLGEEPAETSPSGTTLRRGTNWFVQLICLVIMLGLGIYFVQQLAASRGIVRHVTFMFTLGAIGIWRWGWALTHCVRAAIYRYLYYPHLRRQAREAVRRDGPVPDVVVLGTTYKEKTWITSEVFGSVFVELSSLKGLERAPRVIVVTGCDQDDDQIRSIYEESLEFINREASAVWPPELILLRGENGKRQAIASGLKHVADTGVHDDGVVVLMDGDSAMFPGLLRKVLPIFRLKPSISAVTTNEDVVIQGPGWFAEWLSLRFGQRHMYMCSIALSRRLLCLTGRLSVFRGSIASNPSFQEQIHNDRLEHWLFGEYQMLSGDDKSTWFWLVSRGHEMLYVPDAMSRTYEVIGEGGLKRAIANMRRWSGNMLRNAGRAAAVGPRKLKLFPWLCVLDQQISLWTVMIGPTGLLLALLTGRYDFACAYGLWLLFTRTLRVLPSCQHGRRISPLYVPMQLFSEWLGAIVKMWVYFHPVKQNWLNRGNRTLDSSKQASYRHVRRGLATSMYGIAVVSFVFLVGIYTSLIPILHELPLAKRSEEEKAGMAASIRPQNVTLFGSAPKAPPHEAATSRPMFHLVGYESDQPRQTTASAASLGPPIQGPLPEQPSASRHTKSTIVLWGNEASRAHGPFTFTHPPRGEESQLTSGENATDED